MTSLSNNNKHYITTAKGTIVCMYRGTTRTGSIFQDVELSAGLGAAIGLLAVELLGFLSGISMFSPTAALLSTAAHASASVALAYFCLDAWDCGLYWWVFATCSALPAACELLLMVGVLSTKRSL